MQITWHGLSCIRLQTKETTIILDPLSTSLGLQAPRLQGDVFVFGSAKNPQLPKAKATDSFVIDGPGEYEVRGVMINGIAAPQADDASLTLFTVETEGMVLGHLGALGVPINGPQVEHLKDIDLLCIPVGGKPVLTAKQATELISVLEPRVVIPFYYRIPGLTVKLDGLEGFLKELGAKSESPQEKVRITRKELPEEDMRVIVLKV